MPRGDRSTIVILDYPGAQQSAILGMLDVFSFARQHATALGGSFPDISVCALPLRRPCW